MTPEQSLKNQKAFASYKIAIARYVRSGLTLKGWQFSDLAEALSSEGVHLTPENLRNKVSRGVFAADLLVLIVKVLDLPNAYHTINVLVAEIQKEQSKQE